MDVDADLYINGERVHSFKSFLPSFKQGCNADNESSLAFTLMIGKQFIGAMRDVFVVRNVTVADTLIKNTYSHVNVMGLPWDVLHEMNYLNKYVLGKRLT